MKQTRSMKRILAAFLVVLMMVSLLPTAAFAEADDFVVNVTDASSAPIDGAAVSFKLGGEVLASATTGADGIARFDSEVIGTADTCSVSAEGYQAKDVPVSGPVSPMAVSLEAAAPAEPEKVVVSGTVTDGTSPVGDASVALSGGQSYSATTDASGAFSIADVVKSGSYTLTVSKSGYKSVSQTANLEGSNDVVLSPKESVTLSFEKASVELAMGSTASNAVTNSGGRAVSYASSDTSVVTVDGSGNLTPQKKGTATVTASCAEDANYLASTGSYTVNVVAGTQTLTFENGSAVTLVLKNALTGQAYAGNKAIGKGTITYSVVSGADLLENFDAAAGSFNVLKTGEIKVKASAVSEDYGNAEAEYTLTVTPAFDGSAAYEIKGDQRGENVWFYSEDVFIAPKNGYAMMYANAEINNALGIPATGTTKEFLLTADKDQTEHTPDGIYSQKNLPLELYVFRGEGENTEVVLVTLPETFKDSMLPEATLTVESKSDWTNEFLYIISFGTRGSEDPAKLTIEAKDNHSNVKKIQYFIDAAYDVHTYTTLTYDELKALDDSAWKDYQAEIPLTPGELTTNGEEVDTTMDAYFTAYAKITDNAGNIAFYNSDGIILDTKIPSAELLVDDGSETGAALEEGKVYTDDVSFLVSATDVFEEEEETEPAGGEGEGDEIAESSNAGIKTVSYWVTADEKTFADEDGHSEDKAIVLFEAPTESEDGVTPADLKHTWISASDKNEEKIALAVADYAGYCAIVHIKVTDRADNSDTVEIPVNFDTTPPTLEIVYDGAYNAETNPDGIPFFNAARKVTVKVTQNSASFNPDLVKINVAGSTNYTVGSWKTVKGATARQDVHSAVISFSGDGVYSSIGVDYTYNGQPVTAAVSGEATPYTAAPFGIDRTAPRTTANSKTKTEWTSEEVLGVQIPRLSKVTRFTGTFNGEISGIKNAYYLISKTELNEAQLKDPSLAWTEKTGDLTGTVELDKRVDGVLSNPTYYVYTKAVDWAGNVGYSLEGGRGPSVEVTPTTEPNNGYYPQGLKLHVKMTANKGWLASARYDVFYGSTESVVTSGNITINGYRPETFETDIPLPNSVDNDEVYVVVIATDSNNNEGSGSTNALKIDPTAPTLNINTTPAPGSAEGKICYLNALPASIRFEVVETAARFDPSLFQISITGEEGSWTLDENWTDASDGSSHSKTARLTVDGTYTVSASGTDKAGNQAVIDGNFKGKETIVIDLTAPSAELQKKNLATDNSFYGEAGGFLLGKKIGFSAVASDATSGVKEVCYYKSATELSAAELNNLGSKWEATTAVGADKTFLTIDATEKAYVYIRVTDNAGNVTYASSNGVIVDTTAPTQTVTAPTPNSNGFHVPVNGIVTVSVAVDDGAISSGLQQVSYTIKADGAETEEGALFTAAEGSISTTSGNYKVKVNAAKFDADKVTVTVVSKDTVGNETTGTVVLKISAKAPEITVSFDNNEVTGTDGAMGFFQAARTATVTVNCRPSAFGTTAPTGVITVSGSKLDGSSVSVVPTDWMPPDWTNNGDIHTTTVEFPEGIFSFEVGYTDLAENTANVSYGDSQYPNSFTVDLTAPTGTLTFDELKNVDQLLQTITFGLFKQGDLLVTATAADEISPITEVAYYKSHGDEALDEAALNELPADAWTAAEDISNLNNIQLLTVSPDERAVPYVRITDASGRRTYLMTKGAVSDATASVITLAPAEKAEQNDIYKADVDMNYIVNEQAVEDADFSGIVRIEWWTVVKDVDGEVMTDMGEGSEEKPNVIFGEDEPAAELTLEQLLELVKKEDKFTVGADKNNSNNVTVYLRTVDNAGNKSTAEFALSIDKTAPDVTLTATKGFSNADASATITVKERNFDPESAVITVTKNGQPFEIKPEWTSAKGTGNGDDQTFTGKLGFGGDGAYAITAITVTDKAGNKTTQTFTGNSAVSFTVDKTAPTMTITYDNNDVTNEKYYKAGRIATITVTDTNFDAANSTVEIEATDNGAKIASPTLNGWNNAGTTHTATVEFKSDAHYTFKITVKDQAGNALSQTEPDFYVDTIKPRVEVSGVDDQSSNNTSEKIGIVLTATDTNFDVFEPKVVASITDENGKPYKSLVTIGKITDIANGKVFTIDDLPDDGIYTVTVTVVDRAGNAFEKVTMIDSEGNRTEVDKTANDPLLTFSVNRNGSAYELDENTQDLTGKYYVQHVYDDVVIVEVNADDLEDYEITVNGKPLTPNEDYKVERTGGEGNWTKYTYTIPKELFEEEGEYNIVASSTDKANNSAFSDVKGAAVTFVVDRTAPIVTVSGMESGGRYQTERQTVTIIPTDDGGALASLFVALVNDRGETIKELINLSGKDLAEAMQENDGIFTIELEEGLFQNVRIICKDCAVDQEGNVNTYDGMFTDVSVSSSSFMIFWANRPLRYGVLGGIGGLLLLFFLLLFKRRKKDEDEEKAA